MRSKPTSPRRSAPLRALTALPPPAEIVDRVAAALPKDGALVEFIAYADRPLVPSPARPGPRLPASCATWRWCSSPMRTHPRARPGPRRAHRPRRLAPARCPGQPRRRLPSPRPGALPARLPAPAAAAGQAPTASSSRPMASSAWCPSPPCTMASQFLVDAFDFTYLTSGKDLLPRPQETAPSGLRGRPRGPGLQRPAPSRRCPPGQRPRRAERSASRRALLLHAARGPGRAALGAPARHPPGGRGHPAPASPGPALPGPRGHQGAAAAPAHPRHPPPRHPRLLPGGRPRAPGLPRASATSVRWARALPPRARRIPCCAPAWSSRGRARPGAPPAPPSPARQRAGDGAGAGGAGPVGHPAGGPVRLRHRPRRRQARPGRLRAAPGLRRGGRGDGGDEPVEGERRDDAAR